MLVQPPGPHLGTDLLQGILADRRAEPGEYLPVPGAHAPRPEGEPQEVERRVLGRAAPRAVLAVHQPGLVRVQAQADLLHPLFHRLARTIRACFSERQCTTASSTYRSNGTAGNFRAIHISNA